MARQCPSCGNRITERAPGDTCQGCDNYFHYSCLVDGQCPECEWYDWYYYYREDADEE